jgi:hypothetical protein
MCARERSIIAAFACYAVQDFCSPFDPARQAIFGVVTSAHYCSPQNCSLTSQSMQCVSDGLS